MFILGIYFACYYGADKGRSYIGLKAVTATGKRCALSGNGSNFCRNFDGSEESPWCGTGKDAQKEICNVDECDGMQNKIHRELACAEMVLNLLRNFSCTNVCKCYFVSRFNVQRRAHVTRTSYRQKPKL